MLAPCVSLFVWITGPRGLDGKECQVGELDNKMLDPSGHRKRCHVGQVICITEAGLSLCNSGKSVRFVHCVHGCTYRSDILFVELRPNNSRFDEVPDLCYSWKATE